MIRLFSLLIKYCLYLLLLIAVLVIPFSFYAVRGIPKLHEAKAFALCLYSLKDNFKTDGNYFIALFTDHRTNHPIEINQEVALFPLPSMTVLISSENNRYKTCQTKDSIDLFYKSLKEQGYKYQVSLDGRKSFERGNYNIAMSFKNSSATDYGIYSLGHSILMLGDK